MIARVYDNECTLSWPSHLLLCINARLRCAESEPHCTTAVPALNVRSSRDLSQVILRRSRVVDLLGGQVVHGRSGGHGHDVGSIAGGVAAYIRGRWVLDALLRASILGLAGCGPVLLFSFAVHH
jgi:hypothetical protein